MDLRGSACLVTGASRGIGRAVAVELARAGARVAVTGRDRASLDRVAGEVGGPAIPADLAAPGEADRVAAEAVRALGRVDVLVNNAGLGWSGPFAGMDPGRAEEIVAVNLVAPIRLTRAVLPAMLERRRGAVVNVASIAGHVGVREEAVYAATKAGLLGFSESLRYEVAGAGVAVITVSPGVVATDFFARRGRPYGRRLPRPIPPHRVARAVVRAIRTGRPDVFVPAWMAFPAWLRGTWPGLYRRLAARFG